MQDNACCKSKTRKWRWSLYGWFVLCFVFASFYPKYWFLFFLTFGGSVCREGGISPSQYSCLPKGNLDLPFEGSQQCFGVTIGVCRTRPEKGNVCKDPSSTLLLFHVHDLPRAQYSSLSLLCCRYLAQSRTLESCLIPFLFITFPLLFLLPLPRLLEGCFNNCSSLKTTNQSNRKGAEQFSGGGFCFLFALLPSHHHISFTSSLPRFLFPVLSSLPLFYPCSFINSSSSHYVSTLSSLSLASF